ncbi:MAG: NfeD family protein [Treponemataceae bacterium]|nr:NfeD family protein [Treponemataceae bacterium]
MTPLVWLSIGIGLMALEAIVPGFILFWFGAAALVISFSTWVGFTTQLEWQVLGFFLFAIGFLVLWFSFARKRFKKDGPRDITISGQRGTITKTVVPGQIGEVELFDSLNGLKKWKVIAEVPLEVGTEVEVIETSGIKLKVKPVSVKRDEKESP